MHAGLERHHGDLFLVANGVGELFLDVVVGLLLRQADADRKCSATRQGWSKGIGGYDASIGKSNGLFHRRHAPTLSPTPPEATSQPFSRLRGRLAGRQPLAARSARRAAGAGRTAHAETPTPLLCPRRSRRPLSIGIGWCV